MNEEFLLIISFYLGTGTGTDHMGRRLEDAHDYIHWLFRLYVRSRFNDHVPLLTGEVREAFIDKVEFWNKAVETVPLTDNQFG